MAIPYVREVSVMPMSIRTTTSNQEVDDQLRGKDDLATLYPNDTVYDANGAFIAHERAWLKKERPDLFGIRDFWLQHFGFKGYDCHIDKPAFGLEIEALDAVKKTLALTPGKQVLGIVLRAGDSRRDCLPPARVEVIADWAKSCGYEVVLLGTEDASYFSGAKHLKTTDLQTMAAGIYLCDVVLTPDTGLLHLAEALGVLTVSLWGVVDPKYRVLGYDTIVVPKQPVACSRLGQFCNCCSVGPRPYSCTKSVPLHETLEAIQTQMKFASTHGH